VITVYAPYAGQLINVGFRANSIEPAKSRMHIYIDESGIFNNPANKRNVASCVVALIIPSTYKLKLFKEFLTLAQHWPKEDGEVKGRLLGEDQIAALTDLLQKYDCIVEINAIDLGIHTQADLDEFHRGTCEQIAGWATEDRPEDFKQRVAEIAGALRKPKTPIFVEGFLLMVLLPRVLQTAINYYARRLPKELRSFQWTIDAKEKYVTEFEQAWFGVIFPSIEHQTKGQPIIQAEGGDYTYLEKFYTSEPDVLERVKGNPDLGEGQVAGLRLHDVLAKSFKFEDSKHKTGLQLADVIANATQRALNGKLRESGWLGIGRLLVNQTDPGIRLIRLDPNAAKFELRREENPCFEVINKLVQHAKPLWLDPVQEAYLLRQARRRRKREAEKNAVSL